MLTAPEQSSLRGKGRAVVLRPESVVVADGRGSVVTFDRAGRLYGAFLAGRIGHSMRESR